MDGLAPTGASDPPWQALMACRAPHSWLTCRWKRSLTRASCEHGASVSRTGALAQLPAAQALRSASPLCAAGGGAPLGGLRRHALRDGTANLPRQSLRGLGWLGCLQRNSPLPRLASACAFAIQDPQHSSRNGSLMNHTNGNGGLYSAPRQKRHLRANRTAPPFLSILQFTSPDTDSDSFHGSSH